MNKGVLKIPPYSTLLLDTNVLIDSVEYPEEFQQFYDALNAVESVSHTLSPIIRLEFFRGFGNKAKANELLERALGKDNFTLPIDQKDYDLAYDIARIYLSTANKKISTGDLLIASEVAKYSIPKRKTAQMVLATQNHKDFSPVLFDLIDVMNIPLRNGQIKTIGFYTFDADRFDKAKLAKI